MIFAYPGVHADVGPPDQPLAVAARRRLAARTIAELTRILTGVDIHPGAVLGPGLFIDHATGVVIGETAEVGDDVTLYHGVTLGGTGAETGKRHPTVGDRVIIGAGAKVLGAIKIGDDSRIGANAVVVKEVPSSRWSSGCPDRSSAVAGRASRRRLRCCPTWSASACNRCSPAWPGSKAGRTAPRPTTSSGRRKPASGTAKTSRSERFWRSAEDALITDIRHPAPNPRRRVRRGELGELLLRLNLTRLWNARSPTALHSGL